jgi:deoxyribonuclease-4
MSTLAAGGHVDQTDPVAEARAREATLSQFFLGDPQGWKGPVVAYAGGAAALRDDARAAGVDLYVHAPYVLNVATSNNRIRIPSRKLLQQTVTLAAEIGAKGVIVHGGHVLKAADLDVGFDNWRKCVERTELRVPLLIENTAGGENAMARWLERIARLWDAVSEVDTAASVGFCLDTCHAHAAGVALGDVVEQVMAITGRIDLVHANDSRDGFDSGADRHANLGDGQIDPEELVGVVRQAGAPVVVETPGGVEGQARDISWLRKRLAAGNQ